MCVCVFFNALCYSFQPFRDNKNWFSSGTAHEDAAIRGGDKLVLRGLKFHGFHGVKPEERKLGQKFLIDVDAWMDLRVAGRSDQLSDTISYTEIYRSVIAHHLLHFLYLGSPYIGVLVNCCNSAFSHCCQIITSVWYGFEKLMSFFNKFCFNSVAVL